MSKMDQVFLYFLRRPPPLQPSSLPLFSRGVEQKIYAGHLQDPIRDSRKRMIWSDNV